jgi:plastocyanin
LEIAVKLRHVTASLVALAAVGGPLAGCGGDDSDSSPSDTQSGGSAQPASATGSTTAAQASTGSGSVSISDFKFAPASLTVDRGTRVTVANHDTTAHTATADSGSAFDTGDIDPGSSASFTLAKAGSYSYHCSIHSFMHGTIVVR